MSCLQGYPCNLMWQIVSSLPTPKHMYYNIRESRAVSLHRSTALLRSHTLICGKEIYSEGGFCLSSSYPSLISQILKVTRKLLIPICNAYDVIVLLK